MKFGITLTEKLFIKLINLLQPNNSTIEELIKIFNITNESYKDCYLQDIDLTLIPENLYNEYYELQTAVNFNTFIFEDKQFTIVKLMELTNEPMFCYIECEFENFTNVKKITEYFKTFDLQDYVEIME